MTVHLYNNDCLEELLNFTNNYVDMVFTSVPFKNEDIGALDDNDYWAKYAKWHNEMIRISKYFVCVVQSPNRMNEQIIRFPPNRTLIWGKGVIMSSCRYNPIFCYTTGDKKIGSFVYSDCFGVEPVPGEKFKRISTNKVHQYQDPIVLYETIIKMFTNCNSICDPFMGSGTTGIACANLDKNFEGIELDSKTFKEAKLRISLAANLHNENIVCRECHLAENYLPPMF